MIIVRYTKADMVYRNKFYIIKRPNLSTFKNPKIFIIASYIKKK